MLTALQQGTIDGCDNVHNVQYADRYYEFAKYISITEHAVHFNGLTINNALFEGLSADLQADILAAAQEAARRADRGPARGERRAAGHHGVRGRRRHQRRGQAVLH